MLEGIEFVGHPSSYFLWLPLPEDARADQIALALLQEKVAVSTAEPFSISTSTPHALRLALGSVSMDELRDGLGRVKRIIEVYL